MGSGQDYRCTNCGHVAKGISEDFDFGFSGDVITPVVCATHGIMSADTGLNAQHDCWEAERKQSYPCPACRSESDLWDRRTCPWSTNYGHGSQRRHHDVGLTPPGRPGVQLPASGRPKPCTCSSPRATRRSRGVTHLPEPLSPRYRSRVPEVSHSYRSHRVRPCSGIAAPRAASPRAPTAALRAAPRTPLGSEGS